MTLIADALDLVHRLPHTWRRAQTLDIPIWRARRVAQTHPRPVGEGRRPRRPGPRPPAAHPRGHPPRPHHRPGHRHPHARGARHPRGTSPADLGRDPAPPEPHRVRRHQRAPRHRRHDDPHAPLRPDLRHRRPPQDRTATKHPSASARPGPSPSWPAPRRPSSTCTSTPTHPSGRAEKLGPATLAKIKDWVGHSRVTIQPVLRIDRDRRGRRPRPTRLDARPGHPPRPPLRVPALPTRRPGLRPRPHHPLRRHRPTRPNPTRQPRPPVPTTPPRQDHRPLAIPTTARRHLPMDRTRDPAPRLNAQHTQVQCRRITVATSNGSLPRCAASTPAPSGEPV